MATIRPSNELLSRPECNHLKRELAQVIKPHRAISIDIKGVKNIDKEGLKILQDIMRHAAQKKCTIQFTNIHPSISASISKLKEIKVQFHNEFEEI